MRVKELIYILYIPFCFMSLQSCKKYLDAKPDKKLVIPASVSDLQGLLDYSSYMNKKCSNAGAIAADNYYLTDAKFSSLRTDRERRAYLWGDNIFSGMSPSDWQNEYTVVYNANVVLDNIGNIERTSSNAIAWNNCKGSALVYRAKAFYEIAQIWAKAYDSTTAATDLGIPLRLTSDFNVKSTRSTMAGTYNRIISDLKTAVPLLPDMPSFPYRPSKCAAYGLLARTYLVMHDYNRAKLYADSCLEINHRLLDYNDLDTNMAYPFSSVQFTNPEDIMHTTCSLTNLNLIYLWANVDSVLYNSYSMNDLRKDIFFESNSDGSHYFTGSYEGTYVNYNGISTDEMYLIRAECNARMGESIRAMKDLNTLLEKRWKAGTFIPYTASTSEEALVKILQERKKELIFRMLRFTDIKRLNKEGMNIVQKRIIEGRSYTLFPNDPRYALPIPINVIQYTNMKQN